MLFTLTPQAMPVGYGDALLPIDECCQWLRVDADDELEIALISALRDAAVDMVERYTSLYLAPRTELLAQFERFGSGMILGRGPIASVQVTAISYRSAAGDMVSLPDTAWRYDVVRGEILPAVGARWPQDAAEGVAVTFSAGFVTGQAPPALLQAARMFLAHLYANREAVMVGGQAAEVPFGVRTLCDLHRMPVL